MVQVGDSMQIDRKARMRLKSQGLLVRPADDRVHDFNETVHLGDEKWAQYEASRCIHCYNRPACQEACTEQQEREDRYLGGWVACQEACHVSSRLLCLRLRLGRRFCRSLCRSFRSGYGDGGCGGYYRGFSLSLVLWFCWSLRFSYPALRAGRGRLVAISIRCPSGSWK